jgi:hypothetical protein
MPRRAANLLLALLTLVPCGCASQFVKYPNFFNPGTIKQQRYEAVIWDPYPDSSIGPPVVGGRPREYGQQLPAAQRAQIWSEMFWGPRPTP